MINASRAVAAADPESAGEHGNADVLAGRVPERAHRVGLGHSRYHIPPPPGGEGCTPGYWKQDQHFDSWVGFDQDDTLEDVFNVPDALGLDDVTLLEALRRAAEESTRSCVTQSLRC